jgi:thymidylate kinase
MKIILEGVDGSGKTSLAEQLSRQTGYPIIHHSKPETEEDRLGMLQMYLKDCKSKTNAILDRSWYSELVYGKVMRNKSYINIPQMYELEETLAKTGGLIIYCTGLASILWKVAMHRGEDYITNQTDFMALCNEYDTIMNLPHYIPVVKHEFKQI